jgi:hypothetical protein
MNASFFGPLLVWKVRAGTCAGALMPMRRLRASLVLSHNLHQSLTHAAAPRYSEQRS